MRHDCQHKKPEESTFERCDKNLLTKKSITKIRNSNANSKRRKSTKTDIIKPYQSTEQVKGELKRQIARKNAQSKYENEIYRFTNLV